MVREILVTDDFEADTLDAAWTEEGVTPTHFDVDATGYCHVVSTSGNRVMLHDAETYDADQYAEALIAYDSGSVVQIGLRCGGADDNTGYEVMSRAVGVWEITRLASNRSDTLLGSSFTPSGLSFPNTYKLTLERRIVAGDVELKVYLDDALIETRTDNSVNKITTAGKPGIFGNGGAETARILSIELGNTDGGVEVPDPVTNLTCTRDAPDNVLDWTASADGVTYQVARSATGVGDPGEDGTDGDWELIEDDAGDVETYTDADHARAYYAVRCLDSLDTPSEWELADDVIAITPISDMTVTRTGGTDNTLGWTASASGDIVSQQIARSPTGVGDPGVDGADLDWTLIAESIDDDIDEYVDEDVDPAFYRIRLVHTEGDKSAWGNLEGNVSGETPCGVWLSYPGVVLASAGAMVRCLVGARHNRQDGGVAYVNFAISVNGGAATNVQVSAKSLARGNEMVGTDPLTGCDADEQAPVDCYALAVTAGDYAEGTIDVTPTVVPTAGIPLEMATHRHYNNKSGGAPPPSTLEIFLDGTNGNDSNNGLTSGAPKLTWQAAAIAAGVGGTVSCLSGTSYFNKSAGTMTLGTTGSYWCTTQPAAGVTDAVFTAEAGYANKPAITPSAGTFNLRFAGWNGGNQVLGRLRCDVAGTNLNVCWDHCEITAHSPWADTSNPNVGAMDEGLTQFLYPVTSGEPDNTYFVGCHVHHINGSNMSADANTLWRGSRISTGYGIAFQVPEAGNFRVVSCQVDNWRHASVGVDGVFDVTSTQLEALESPDRAGKLRVRSVLGQSVASFATQAALLATSSSMGCKVAGFANAGGNDDNYVILAAGTDGSSRQWVDLDVADFTEAAGNSVQLRTCRISDGAEWSTVIHSDVWKVNSVTPVNCLFQHIYQDNNGTPRGFGWDGGTDRCWFVSVFSALTGDNGVFQIRNDDFDQGTNTSTNSGWLRCSFASDVNYDSGSTVTKSEILQCVFEGLSASDRTVLAGKFDMAQNHFVSAGDACGSSTTTGTAFDSATPGLDGDATLDAASGAVGSATELTDPITEWFIGNRGVDQPCLTGDFSVEAGGGALDAIGDLFAVRVGGTDNSLTWTPGVGAGIHQVARSATGVGSPGASGTDGDWELIEASLSGLASSYLDEDADEAYYRVRYEAATDETSPWSNRVDTISGGGGGGGGGSSTAGNQWVHSVTLVEAGSAQLKAGPTGSRHVIDSITISGHGGADTGTVTITSEYKRAPKTIFGCVFPTTVPFKAKRRSMKLKAVRMGDLTVVASEDVTVTVTVSGHTEEDRVPEAALPVVDDGEWIVLDIVQPDTDEPYVSYTYDGQMIGIKDPKTGLRHYPQREYVLPAADASDPFAEASITVVGNDETHTIFISTRNYQVTRWHTTLTGLAEVKWLNRCDYGREIGCGTFAIDEDGTARRHTNNPTTQGSQLRPLDLTIEGQVRLPPSYLIPDSYGATSALTAAEQASIFTAVHPLHYDPNGEFEGGPQADHGGDDDHLALYWDDIHAPIWHPRVNLLEGTHRLTFWHYNRLGRPINPLHPDALFSGFSFLGANLNDGFTRAEARTIGDPTPTRIVSFTTATFGTASCSPVNVAGSEDMDAEDSDSSLFTGSYVAGVLSRSADAAAPAADDFCIVLACKFGDWFVSTADKLGTANFMNFSQFQGSDPGTPHNIPVEDFPDCSVLSIGATSFVARRPGWLQLTGFFITCKYSQIETRLDTLLASGLMDQVFTGLPAATTANTDWPPPS